MSDYCTQQMNDKNDIIRFDPETGWKIMKNDEQQKVSEEIKMVNESDYEIKKALTRKHTTKMKQHDPMHEQHKAMEDILKSVLTNVGLESAHKEIKQRGLPVRVYVPCSDDESSAFELEVDYDYYQERNTSLTLIGITPSEAETLLKIFLTTRKVE